MPENKIQITRMLTPTQKRHMEKLAEYRDVSQSEVMGDAITEAFHRECADRAGISYEEFMESVNKGEF